jgi:hypothetical protein
MANRNNLPVLVFDFDDTLINTKREDGKTHPLALAYMIASTRQSKFNPVYDHLTRQIILEKHGMELSTPIGQLIDLTPLLNQHLIEKVLIPAATLREQGKIGAILILSNTALKTQLTWFDQYMLDKTGSVGQFGVLRKGVQANNSKPFNNGTARSWQYFETSTIDWEDKQYFFDYIMERNNRARGDLTFVNASKLRCLGLSCISSKPPQDNKKDMTWTRKTIQHVTYMTSKLDILAPRNVFFFDDLSPTNEFHHPIADDLKEKYVHIRSKARGSSSERDGYGVFDKYDIHEDAFDDRILKLSEMIPYEDATVYPQALLNLLAEANPANVSVNFRAPENALEPPVGGKRRRITKHKKTLKRRQSRSRRRA